MRLHRWWKHLTANFQISTAHFVSKHSILSPDSLLTNLWEVSIRVLPLSRTCIKLFHSWRLAIGSTPVVGSSRKIIEGLPISATPTFNLRWLPPLNEIIKQSTSGWRTNFDDDKCELAATLRGSRPGVQSASLYVNFGKPGNYVIVDVITRKV